MLGGFKEERDEALKKAEAAEERLKKATIEQERITSKLLNLRRNSAKLLRCIQEVSFDTHVSTVVFSGCIVLVVFPVRIFQRLLLSFQDPSECIISADDVSEKVDEAMKEIADQAEERL